MGFGYDRQHCLLIAAAIAAPVSAEGPALVPLGVTLPGTSTVVEADIVIGTAVGPTTAHAAVTSLLGSAAPVESTTPNALAVIPSATAVPVHHVVDATPPFTIALPTVEAVPPPTVNAVPPPVIHTATLPDLNAAPAALTVPAPIVILLSPANLNGTIYMPPPPPPAPVEFFGIDYAPPALLP